ncbi:MAG: TraB/GumN family protein [Desulfobacter sp.]|nr:MAG: TraB/GumN family protein [Desulfobacter sp.]
MTIKTGKINVRLAALCFFFIALATAHAGSPVWKITKGGNTLYLGGTIHVLGESDYPLPPEFDRAYQASEIIVFETDIAKTQDPQFAQAIMAQMRYTGQRTLQRLIRPATLEALGRFSAERGIPAENLLPFKPGMVMVFLTMAEMERLGAGGAGVDEFYFKKAGQDQRSLRFLESPEAQIRFLAGIGAGKEDKMITYILKDIQKLPRLLPVMKQAWRNGDNARLYKETLAPLKKEYPEIYNSLMVKRNLAWMPVIEQMLATPATEFILVGAAHLAGDQGLITLLRAKGATAVNQ